MLLSANRELAWDLRMIRCSIPCVLSLKRRERNGNEKTTLSEQEGKETGPPRGQKRKRFSERGKTITGFFGGRTAHRGGRLKPQRGRVLEIICGKPPGNRARTSFPSSAEPS